jgi:hypothetical protein
MNINPLNPKDLPPYAPMDWIWKTKQIAEIQILRPDVAAKLLKTVVHFTTRPQAEALITLILDDLREDRSIEPLVERLDTLVSTNMRIVAEQRRLQDSLDAIWETRYNLDED